MRLYAVDSREPAGSLVLSSCRLHVDHALSSGAIGFPDLIFPRKWVIGYGTGTRRIKIYRSFPQSLHQLQNQYCADTNLCSMGNRSFSGLFEYHFPVVRHMVFAARGWPGISVKAHCYTSKHKALHNLPHGFRVTCFDLFGIAQNLCNAVFHQFHDPLAIMLAVDKTSKLPVAETCEFSKKVS